MTCESIFWQKLNEYVVNAANCNCADDDEQPPLPETIASTYSGALSLGIRTGCMVDENLIGDDNRIKPILS